MENGISRGERERERERGKIAKVARPLCVIIMKLNVNAIYHDSRDSHGDWHLKIVPLIISPTAR